MLGNIGDTAVLPSMDAEVLPHRPVTWPHVGRNSKNIQANAVALLNDRNGNISCVDTAERVTCI